MNANDIQNEYLRWLCALVGADSRHHFLWRKLHEMAFVWTIEMDENRAEDGKYLRYLYSLERVGDGVSAEDIEEALGGPCSVMEFLVGLARRIEEDIMYNADAEDRTPRWFSEMVDNLGLYIYDDKHYKDVEIEGIVDRFLHRKYPENGVGNIFKKWPKSDLWPKNIEIWKQAQEWCNEKFG